MPSDTHPSHSARKLARIGAYYLVMAGGVAVVMRWAPDAADLFSGGRLDELAGAGLFGPPTSPPPDGPGGPAAGATAAIGAISMVGALAVMIPVTWIYMLTRAVRGYDESVVHTLLILPIAVTGIVMIVQNSLALAFSLAGIVAAVRFRTTLEDTKDAVYVFLAIGVGLACGVQALGLALVLSLVFNLVNLALWRTRFGNVYAERGTGPGGLTLADALLGPDSRLSARHVGDPGVLDVLSPRDMADVAERSVRMERHISEEFTRKKRKRANALLLVHAAQAGAAQAAVEPVLEELATRWKLVEVITTDEGVVLEYLTRLDGAGVEGAVLDRLDETRDAVRGVELRSLKGLKRRK